MRVMSARGQIRVAAGIVAACLLVAGCSSSKPVHDASSAPSQHQTTATTARATPTASVTKKAKAKITYGTSAKTIATQLHCLNLRPSPTETDAINIPIQQTAEILCDLDGTTVDLSTFDDAAKQSSALTLVKGLEQSFGAEVWIAAGDGWVASAADSGDGSAPLAVQKTVTNKVVSVIGGKAMHWTPSPGKS